MIIKKIRLKLLTIIFSITVISAFGQTGTISGKITEENGDAIIGAIVRIPAINTLGTVSDANGDYKLTNIPIGEITIEYSFTGKVSETKIFTITPNADIKQNITLKIDAKTTDEKIVIGYGTKLKRDITGSISSLKGKEITDMPSQSFEAGIQGKASGIQVTTGSGMAGSGSLIRVRGVASVSAGGDPLYVVDGIQITQDYFLNGNGGGFNNNPLATINPEDIASIDILKDAAATSIYGSRGANGVIIITTKRGQKEGLKFEFTTRLGTSHATFLPQMLKTKEFLQIYQEAWENDGKVGRAALPNNMTWEEAEKNDVDWIKETMGTGFKQMYSLGTTYKKNKFSAYGNFTWDDNGSFIIGSNYKRTSGRLNLDYKPIKWMNIGISTSLSNGINTRVDGGWSGGYGAAMSTALPIYPIYDTSGNFANIGPNPVRQRKLKDWITNENRSINNIKIEFTPTKKLGISVSGSIDKMRFYEDKYEPKALINSNHAGNSNHYLLNIFNYNYNLVVNYSFIDNKIHQLDAMAGTEYQRSRSNSENYFAINANGPYYKNSEVLDSAEAQNNHKTNAVDNFAFNSYFTRIGYSFLRKYIFQATVRTDGSSRFGDNKRYGFFPAISGAWIISDEAFMKSIKSINFLKLRTGIGRTGNANFANNLWRQTYNPATNGGQYGGNPMISPNNLENPNLSWEMSNIWDLTLEIGILKNRITSEISYYTKKTNGVLMNLSVPNDLGFGTYSDNVGSIVNKGIEFNIKSNNINKKFFTWTTDFNIARNFNEILDLGVYSQEAVAGGTNDTRVVKGSPVGTNYVVRLDGIDPLTGKPVYLDNNGNKTYTWNTNYRVEVGSVLPKAFGGLTNTFRYKNFNLNIFFVYKIGGNIYNSSEKRQNGVVTDWNMTTAIFDRWQQSGDLDTRFPRLTTNTSTYGLPPDAFQNNTNLWIFDGTYTRLRNVTLGYNLPTKWFNKKLNSFRISATGTNLFTWSKYKEGDPEIARDFENSADRNMSSNITYLTAPQEKSYSITLNITF